MLRPLEIALAILSTAMSIFLGVTIAIGAIASIVYASITLNKQKEIEDTYLIELSYNELEMLDSSNKYQTYVDGNIVISFCLKDDFVCVIWMGK